MPRDIVLQLIVNKRVMDFPKTDLKFCARIGTFIMPKMTQLINSKFGLFLLSIIIHVFIKIWFLWHSICWCMCMKIIEKRKGCGNRDSARNAKCFCRIKFNSGFIAIRCEIVDVSSRGIRLRFPYKPSISDVIQLYPHFIFDTVTTSDVRVVAKWTNMQGEVYEVGCEIEDPKFNLKSWVERLNFNYCN